MGEYSELIVGGIGLVTTITSGWVSWFFARKKYNSEVDHNLIENMETSLEFYKKLSDDNKDRLEELSVRNRNLEAELKDLSRKVFELSLNICMNLSCQNRVLERKYYISGDDTEDRTDKADTNI